MLLDRNRMFLLFYVVWTSLERGLASGHVSQSPLGIFDNAAAVADNGACSRIGKEVMLQGGNAVESVIAMAICTGVVAPQSSGLGGGHFLTFYNKATRSCTTFDARETAPENVNEELFKNGASEMGWLSIAVPGEIHGFWTAYQKFGGNVPWERLWAPSIKLCRQGFIVTPALAKHIVANARALNNSYFSEYRSTKNGQWKKAGDRIKCKKLADTMTRLSRSKDPVKLFYDSDWTDLMVEEIQRKGGLITKNDMRMYSTKFGDEQRPPIYANFAPDLTFCSPPPPSSGPLTTSILGILNSLNVSHVDKHDQDAVGLLYHRFIEASKFTYGVRSQLGDMDFVASAFNTSLFVNSPEYLNKIREILPEKNLPDPSYYTQSAPFLPDHGTAHMSAIDQYGNAAALTSSINLYFGSRIKSSVTGILYNDHADDFSIGSAINFFNIKPSEANRPLPGKRPMSSMAPVVGFNPATGEARISVGGAGGVKILSATAQVLMRVLFLNETIKQAIDAPRLFNQLFPYQTTYETGFPKDISRILHESYGQSIDTAETPFISVVCGINRLSNGSLEANSDYRKAGGYPDGF